MHIGSQQAADHSAIHSIHHFVNGPVAAQHQNQVRAIPNRLRGKFGRVSCLLGGKDAGPQTRAGECVSGTL
jgi:hypothetical protein